MIQPVGEPSARVPPPAAEPLSPVDWPALVLSPGWLARFQTVARRRFGDTALAEEAVTAAMAALADRDWAAFAGYDGRASPATYILTLFCHALEDFHRQRFGRPRPPAWIERLGPLWKRIYVLLCRQRRPPEAIVNLICESGQRPAEETVITPAWVHRAIHLIRAKAPRCGEQFVEISTDPAAAELTGYAASGPVSGGNPEALWAAGEQFALFWVLTGLLQQQAPAPAKLDAIAQELVDRTLRHWADLPQRLQLSDDERLLLRLIFQDGHTVAQAARILKVKDHTLRRRLKAALSRIREVFQEAGLSAEAVRAMLAEEE